MKPTCALAYVLLTSLAGVAQTAPSTNGVERVPSAGGDRSARFRAGAGGSGPGGRRARSGGA
jgi:hypothetical protein